MFPEFRSQSWQKPWQSVVGSIDARKWLQRFLTGFPESPTLDQAFYGLLVADMKQGKRADAEKRLSELKRSFPLSPSTEAASRLLADAR